MKLFNTVRRLRKQLAATAIVLTAIAFPVVSIAAQTVKLEGSLGVANVTRGDTKYARSVNASYDQVVKLQVYYHNTENPNSGKVAKNLTVKINIPKAAGKTQTVSSKISASNANTVKSTATVKLDKSDAYLQYIPGSAVWKHNTGTNQKVKYVETKISDNVVNAGQGLRLEDEKPCYNFAATVTVLARVMRPGVLVTKQVEKASETGKWASSNTANPGDVLKYKISYKNNGNTNQSDVVIRDSLPVKMSLVPNTTRLYNATNPNGTLYNSNNITRGGIVIGNYGPGAIAYITFEVKVPAATALNCGETTFTNVGVARPKGMNEYYDSAVTTVNKVCENQPVYSCDQFTLTADKNRTVTVAKFSYTAKDGATFNNAVLNWGDNSNELTTNNVVGQKHTFAKDGEYTVRATAHFTVNGKDVTSVGNCTQKVSFNTPTTPTTTTTPTELPNTGAGEVIGLFAAVTAAGAIAHRFMSRRTVRG
ncbi:MAG: DUF11 domain-containing protein [Candidatus Saccharibacteria bacterium]|nr:DUF11 domain-containing protein [Candidatus Saccharibacteria bacterium]